MNLWNNNYFSSAIPNFSTAPVSSLAHNSFPQNPYLNPAITNLSGSPYYKRINDISLRTNIPPISEHHEWDAYQQSGALGKTSKVEWIVKLVFFAFWLYKWFSFPNW